MADTATAPAEGTETSQDAASSDGRPTGLENFVRDAIRSAGMKVADLNDEQRERAVSAPTTKGGLRGKDLGTYILEGESGLEDARNKATAAKPKTHAQAACRVEPLSRVGLACRRTRPSPVRG
jgi:hypothetical protein